MNAMLLLLALLGTAPGEPQAAIEARIEGTDQPLLVALLSRGDGTSWTLIEEEALPPGQREVRFGHLKAGVYQLLVRGIKNTDRMAEKIILGGGDTRRVVMTIAPFELAGTVAQDAKAVGAGVVTLRHAEMHWRATIPFAADGTFRTTMWQRGEYTLSVAAAAITPPHTGSIRIDGDAPVRVAIHVPDGRITGTVREAKSGEPIGDTLVTLQTITSEGTRQSSVRTDSAGRFAFTAVRHGRHTLQAVSPSHLVASPVQVELQRTLKERALEIRLETGRKLPIVALDADQHSVANATVVAISGGTLQSRTTTASDGRATVSVPAADASTIFVIPAAGFGMARAAADAGLQPLRVDVRRAASSLVIRTRTTSGDSLPPFSLLMRYDGERLPAAVTEELESVQGLQLTTDERGEVRLRQIPAGRYEFWPYRTADEAESIAAAEQPAPIQVDVRSGENAIAVTFAPRGITAPRAPAGTSTAPPAAPPR